MHALHVLRQFTGFPERCFVSRVVLLCVSRPHEGFDTYSVPRVMRERIVRALLLPKYACNRRLRKPCVNCSTDIKPNCKLLSSRWNRCSTTGKANWNSAVQHKYDIKTACRCCILTGQPDGCATRMGKPYVNG